MSLDFVARNKMVAAVASILLVGALDPALGRQGKDASKATKREASRAERVSGVIVKAEKVAKSKGKGKSDPIILRLSINTNAVWRDWARDQAQVRDEGSPKKDAAKGADSIATKGEPVDENSLVVVEVTPGTRVETRFRSPSDETSKGATSPDKVKSDEGASSTTPKGKPVHFRAEDLLPGLFVEADYRQSGSPDENTAASVAVIRPIEVINASPKAKSAPK